MGFQEDSELQIAIEMSPSNEHHQRSSLSILKQPITMEWENVTYYGRANHPRTDPPSWRPVLENVSGCALPGQIVAIMGASGAGKTTLLNVLAGRIPSEKTFDLSGKILVNQQPRSSASWRRLVAYVEQDDIMYENLTVRETLEFAARLRLPRSKSWKEKQGRVNQVIEELGLSKCQNARVGNTSERTGISGGERKRLAIGQELVTDPRLLFLDEPTSGLDAFTASSIIETIKRIATNDQCTVLMTIHQPREYIFTLFDRLVLLSEGKTVYTGDVPGAIQYFAACGLPCTPNTNPSDFFLDTMTIDFRSTELREQSMLRVKKLQESWATRQRLAKRPSDSSHKPISRKTSSITSHTTFNGAGIFRQVGTLVHRNFVNMSRDRMTIGATIGQSLINTTILGFVFWNMQMDFAGVQNRVGSLFFIVVNLMFGNIMPTIMAFTLELQIIRRERSAGTYRAISAFVAKLISHIPLVIFSTVLFAVPVYWMMGLQPVMEKFLIFIFVTTFHAVCSTILGITISSGVPNARVGQIIGPTVVIVFLVFGGQAVNLDSIPGILRWMKYVSIIRYSYSALAINEFTGLSFPCAPSSPPSCHAVTGQVILQDYSLNEFQLWYNEILVATWMLGYLIAGYFLFQWRSRPFMRLK